MDDQTGRRGPRHSTGAEPDLVNGVAVAPPPTPSAVLDGEFDSIDPVDRDEAQSPATGRPVSATRASEQVAPLTSELTLPTDGHARGVGGFVADLFGRGTSHRSRRSAR